jgi:hypothetical protein
MKIFVFLAVSTAGLASCGTTGGNNSVLLNNGNDVRFLQQGSTSCPGIAASNNPIYERYPLRCGPQSQVIPR